MPAKDKTAKGTPAKDKIAKGTPAKDKTAKGTPAKDKTAKGTPAKDKTAKGTPAKDKTAKGTPAKDKTAKGTPAKDKTAKGTPAKVSVSSNTLNRFLRYRLIYSMTGLFLGIVSIAGGIILFLFGVTGSTNWTAKFFGFESNLTDAAPGVILFTIGLFIIIFTRLKGTVTRAKYRQ
jgi:hypothetical protein